MKSQLEILNDCMQHGRVYFIQKGTDGPIKIGFSADPSERLKSLQTGSSDPLILRGSIKGPRAMEGRYHRHYAEDRILGEWFRPSPGLLALLGLLAARKQPECAS